MSGRWQGALEVPPVHFVGDDGLIHEVTIQGKTLEWKVRQVPSEAPKPKKRGAIVEFSRASRLRILKLIGQIDWKKAAPCLFITLTYPDSFTCDSYKDITQSRSVFWRYLEKNVKRKVACVWRIEWKPRKTGANVGKVMPHFHLLVFNVSYIDYNEVNEWWKKAIGEKEYVRTEVKGMENEEMAAAYVAKYAAKLPDSSLVNASYLNRPVGRNWGLLRKPLIPLHPVFRIRLAQSDESHEIREVATKGMVGKNVTGMEGFTVLGNNVFTICAMLKAFGFDVPKDW